MTHTNSCGRLLLLGLVAVAVLVACATSPTGRRQLEFFSTSQMNQMGDTAYKQIKADTPVSTDAAQTNYVGCITRHLSKVVPSPAGGGRWEVTVFKDDSVNAFALPGGKIGVYSGMLGVAQGQAQLATVIGHEMAHVEAQHTNARLSTQYATDAGVQLVAALAGRSSNIDSNRVMALLGLGAQVGVVLPFSRSQETEADVLGLEYMARAGFDPRESVALWRNMAKQSKGRPPEFLSTHPATESRISNLQQRLPSAMNFYKKARAQGRRPNCG